MSDTVRRTTTIANAATVSAAVNIPGNFSLSGLIYPAMTTSVAFNFQVSLDGTNFTALYDDAGVVYAVTIPAATAGAVALNPAIFYPWERVKLVVADAQTGIKTIEVAVTTI